jgi:crotonobetainyl-CoA:carnitine CoA-transferase CaiB-like acyl-CoA transferase
VSAPGVLDGLRVVDAGSGIGASYCAKLLGDLGATVVRVETGRDPEPVERVPGEPTDDQDASWTRLYCNTGKLGVTLDPEAPEGLDALLKLLTLSDVAVVDPESAYWPVLTGTGPRGSALPGLSSLVTVLVSPYGQKGEHRDYRARHLTTFHAGGEGYLLPGGAGFALFPDRPPIQAAGSIAEYDAGLAAACGALAAVIGRDAGTSADTGGDRGGASTVDVSAQDVQITLGRQYVTTFASTGAMESRSTRAYSAAGMFACADGYIFLYASEDHFWRGLADLIGRPEWKEDPRFATRPARTANWADAEPAVTKWVAERGQEEVNAACRAAGIPVSPYRTPPEILASEALHERGFFRRLAHPVAGALDYPGTGFSFTDASTGPYWAAPRRGEHNATVLGEWLGLDEATIGRAGAAR